MFGYIKKETVEEMISKEVELNRKMYEKYADLQNAVSERSEQGECYKREVERCTQLTDEYFARYQQSKELLNKLKKL